EGLCPSDSPSRSLAGAPSAPLRSRGLTRALVRLRPEHGLKPVLFTLRTGRLPRAASREQDLRIQIHPDTLDLRVVLERMRAHFATEAAVLVTAKWRGGIVHIVGVDPDGARLKLASDVVRLLDVPRPDAGGQPVLSVVGSGDRFIDVGEFERGKHGPEDLFP